MFDSIKNIIGDIASGAIKDQRIALSQEQLTALDSEAKVLASELSEAQRKVSALEQENANLKTQLQRLQPAGALLKETADVLQFFFDQGHDLSIEQIAQRFRFKMSVAEYYFDDLMKRRFVRQTRVGSDNSSGAFGLTHEGREYVMQNRTS